MSLLGKAWDEAVGAYDWLKSLTLGEFAENRPLSVVVSDMLIGFVPGAVVVMSARDLAAVCIRLGKRYERSPSGPNDASCVEWQEWVLLIACAFGVFGPLICAAVGVAGTLIGSAAGAVIGDEAAAFLRAVCLLLIRGGDKVLQEVIRIVSKCVKGDIPKLLKSTHLTKYGDQLVKHVSGFIAGMIRLIAKVKVKLLGFPAIGATRDIIQRLEKMEAQFLAVQRNCAQQIPHALERLEAELQRLLGQSPETPLHPALPAVRAPLPKVTSARKVRLSSGVGERPRELPSAKESAKGGHEIEPRNADKSVEAQGAGEHRAGEETQGPNVHSASFHGAKGPSSRREFDPANAGGPVQLLSTDAVQITNDGIDTVERHISRFDPDPSNDFMVDRLRSIANGDMQATQYDLNYYTHELREYERYINLGWKNGQPEDDWDKYVLWNNAHTATLEDYRISDGDLFYPGVLNEH